MELLSRVYDHVKGRTVKGFNMLTLGWTDNYSFVPVAFNMMASADEKNRLVPASASVDKRKSGYKNRRDAVQRKPEAAVKMIHDALAAGIQAAYVLMDTWFTNEPFIKKVLDEGIDVIGMLKDNKQRYYYKGRLYNLKQLATLMDFDRPCSVFGSVCVKTMKYGIPIKLVYVRNRNKKSEYIVILTTDCSLSDSEIIRTYGSRWSIEVFFRAAKSLLDLGDEFQGLSYDMTVSSTTVVFTRYIILEWLRRKSNDQKTICELFYVFCDDIQDIELSTALKQLLKILCDGIKNRAITITNEIKVQLINWFVSQPHLSRLYTQIDVGSLSKVTPEYLSRMFSREVGRPFVNYLKEYRIGKAKEMLQKGNRKIYEIAFEAGYSDVKYFCRVFKEVTGVSPKKYLQYGENGDKTE